LRERLRKLMALQEIDRELLRIAADRERLDDGSNLKETLAKAERVLASETEKLRHVEGRFQDIELNLESIEEKRNRDRDRLYSGHVMNPKELEDLQASLKQYARQIEELEDRGLEVMDELEEQRKKVEDIDRVRGQLEAQYQEVRENYKATMARLDEEEEQLRGEREEAAAQVDEELLSLYELVCRHTRNTGIVELDDDTCTGCMTSVPQALIRAVSEASRIVQCENCQRILFHDEPDKPPAEEEPEEEPESLRHVEAGEP